MLSPTAVNGLRIRRSKVRILRGDLVRHRPYRGTATTTWGLGEGANRGKALVISIHKVTAVHMYDKVQLAWTARRGKLKADLARMQMSTPDISRVMQQVEELLDASIATEGYVIPEMDGPKALHDSVPPLESKRRVDLSKIDFDALKKFFDQSKSKRASMNQLHQAAKEKVEELMNQNPTRKDLYEKLEALIADYNAGSHNIGGADSCRVRRVNTSRGCETAVKRSGRRT